MGLEFVTDCDTAKAIIQENIRKQQRPWEWWSPISDAEHVARHPLAVRRHELRIGRFKDGKRRVPEQCRDLVLLVKDETRDSWPAKWIPRSENGQPIKPLKPEPVLVRTRDGWLPLPSGDDAWTEGPVRYWIRIRGLPGMPPGADIPPLFSGWARNDGMLSREEERDLVRRFQAGDRAAELRLLRKFFYLINKQAKHKDLHGLPKADLHMVGVAAFFESVSRFDLSKGYRVSTFVTPRIRGAMLDEMRRWQTSQTRDQRWLADNHHKYADQQLIGGSYSAIYNTALIAALVAAMAHPTTGLVGYTKERAIEAIADFEAGQTTQVYDTTAESGYVDGDERESETVISDSPDWAAVSVGGIDDYRPLTDEEWQNYCLARANARYTDSEGKLVTERWLSPWDAHRRMSTHPAPLRQIERQQYETDQRKAHAADIMTRFKLRREWVFAPSTVPELLTATADAAERRENVEVA